MYKLYKITNKVNGKLYVGITKLELSDRWAKHLKDSKSPCYPLHRAIKKYDPVNFSIELLTESDDRAAISNLEEPTILSLGTRKNGYNVAIGGYGGNLGPAANTKRKETIANFSPEKKEFISKKLSKALTGSERSTETKQKMAYLQKERGGYGPLTHRQTTKDKMSASSLGKSKSQIARHRMSGSAIINNNAGRFARKASCLCCHREWDLGNFTQHIKRKNNEL